MVSLWLIFATPRTLGTHENILKIYDCKMQRKSDEYLSIFESIKVFPTGNYFHATV